MAAPLSECLESEKMIKINDMLNHYLVIAKKEFENIRPWSDFCAVLKPPKRDLKHIEQRITTNLVHYKINYLWRLRGRVG